MEILEYQIRSDKVNAASPNRIPQNHTVLLIDLIFVLARGPSSFMRTFTFFFSLGTLADALSLP